MIRFPTPVLSRSRKKSAGVMDPTPRDSGIGKKVDGVSTSSIKQGGKPVEHHPCTARIFRDNAASLLQQGLPQEVTA